MALIGKPITLVVPFAAEDRAGWACLQNRHGRAVIGPEHGELLEVLSAQLGVLLGNVALWQELAATRERLEEENRYWRSTTAAASPGSRIVGDSPALRDVLGLVARVAPTTTAVLVTGETGVGKELVASEIHRQSRRRDGPFIAVHVASFSAGLVASGLFGHERGAFTGAVAARRGKFEQADGGTLFLDEIGDMPAAMQAKVLRVLQESELERVKKACGGGDGIFVRVLNGWVSTGNVFSTSPRLIVIGNVSSGCAVMIGPAASCAFNVSPV